MNRLNARQGFLVSAIVHLTLLMILLSRPLPEKSKPTDDLSSARMAKVFVPPAETLRQVLPPTALRKMPRPAPAPTPPPAQPPAPSAKDRISIGPPIPMKQKGPLILRKEDDLTKVAKGRPDAVPTPQAPTPPMPTPAPTRAADAGTQPKAPGVEGLKLPPGIGRDLQRGRDGSKGEATPTGPSIASSLRNLDRQLQTSGPLGLESGTGKQMGPLFFDPMGADFTAWLQQFKTEVYRNWIMPQAATFGIRGHVDIEFTVERDGSLSQCRILTTSGNPALDKSAKNSLESSMFLPLPSDFGPKNVTMRASFWYNEGPPAES
ncbi:MAG TPA: TonB family protein [Vicinamibacteria bacterium]|nr:TonB family protein [Vicinamibacteria bacterium]